MTPKGKIALGKITLQPLQLFNIITKAKLFCIRWALFAIIWCYGKIMHCDGFLNMTNQTNTFLKFYKKFSNLSFSLSGKVKESKAVPLISFLWIFLQIRAKNYFFPTSVTARIVLSFGCIRIFLTTSLTL